MKQSFLVILFLFFFFIIRANNYEHLHGLRYNKTYMKTANDKEMFVCFDMRGYEIAAETFKGDISKEKDLQRIKKKYKLNDGVQANYSESVFNLRNTVIEIERPLKNNLKVKANESYYILQTSEKEIFLFHFFTLDQRDFIFEREFVQDYLDGKLENYISDDWSGEYMNFVGRNIQLGDACGWKGPNNFYCKGGQISWSIFPSFVQAEIHLQNSIAANKKDNVIILSEDFVEVVFEDIPTIAHRIAYLEENNPNRYPLIVYYICEEVRGQYVSCIMSHYGMNRANYILPDLLEEFMSFSQEPYGAFNKYDSPRFEAYTSEEKEYFDSHISLLEFRLGTFVPLGNLRKAYIWVPSFDIFLGCPIKKDMAIDVSFSVGVPINKNPINVSVDGDLCSTDITAVVGIGVRHRYQKQLDNNLFGSIYGGLGVSFLSTDLEKETSKEKTEYHQIIAFDMYGGMNIRYKKIGYFFEYHHPFYEKSNLVRSDFGNQMLQSGFFFAF